jgi:SSS family solute:Na+ symporter
VQTPTLSLSPLDGAVIGLFLMAILGLGFSAKVRDNSVLQYLAAGRSLSMPAFVATLVSTWYGGVLAVGDSVKAFGFGGIMLNGVPYYFFALVYALFYAERVRGSEQISIPERLSQRWGRPAGLVGAVLIFLLAVPAAHVLMLGTMLHLLTGWSLHLATVVATIGGTLFLYKGGLLADVRAGLLAFVMMYVGFFVIAGWCLTHYPPALAMQHLDPQLKKWDGGVGFLGFLTFFIGASWTLVDPGFHQRVASARSPQVGKSGLYVCIGFWMLFDILSLVTGIYAITILNPNLSGLEFFPRLGNQILPSGLKAVFMCGLIGTTLSAMVGYTLVSGATFGREFVARLKPGMDDAAIKKWSRVGFAVSCVVAVGISFAVRNVAVDLWYAYSGAVVGALLLPVSAIYVPKFRLTSSSGWATASMLMGFFTSFAWLIWCKRTDNPEYKVSISGQEIVLGTLVPGLVASATILGLGEVSGRRALKT